MTVAPKADPAPRFVLTGRHVIGGFVAFFIMVASIDAVLVWLAVSTFGGLDTPDAYRKGLAYNANVAAQSTQDQLGWRDTVRFNQDGASLEATITDRDGKGIENLAVTVSLARPTVNWSDKRLSLQPLGGGRYIAPVADMAPGNWIAAIEARASRPDEQNAAVYRSKTRVWRQP
jgi:nitrogen fixation protein FixH